MILFSNLEDLFILFGHVYLYDWMWNTLSVSNLLTPSESVGGKPVPFPLVTMCYFCNFPQIYTNLFVL